ncbi:hypothetical protein DFQ01_105246 [Paenibacillus cellulosilyticus]|uniref:Uncharacterized protein n=1 Tax=Paenibacillus cellulosilyticus TaxID=375489 RepID=A0A2V2YWC1_9BACL|nr:hypothetical protein [Paenibacillus cellulosilyticus]PWW05261.1 hypothetical protein DFQ01_105246 [Paenibacillus cellulosilyticus]QKS43585.1 hypothetical protein HUB94_03365 [Paenibacillus cellulosilyticus]
MKQHLKAGWSLTVRHLYIIIVLFVYQLLWGFFLYRFVDGIIIPLLRRYPGSGMPASAARLYVYEAEFRLMKTDLIQPYLWTFAGLIVLRMLLTPLLNAGLFHSLHHASTEQGTRFLQGMRRAWLPITILYWVESLLALAPAYWLLPRALSTILSGVSVKSIIMELLPSASGWLSWGVLLHLFFLAMQLSAASGGGAFNGLWRAFRHFLPYIGMSLFLWCAIGALGLFVFSASLLWAGFLAIVVHQGYRFVKTLLKVWTIASQYDCLQSRSQT